jgi:hypothetical protein
MNSNLRALTLFFVLTSIHFVFGQQQVTPDLTKASDAKVWQQFNRTVTLNGGEAYLDARDNDGLLIYKNLTFENGVIEVDIKGKDVRGQSFVGVAFHGKNDSTYDAIYFRPFNFKSPDRGTHAVQYVSHPMFPWHVLREKFPEKYENPISPLVEPNEWFHATIRVKYPTVKVYVNNSETPTLEVEQLSDSKKGFIGLWVGNGSDGSFRNLRVTASKN